MRKMNHVFALIIGLTIFGGFSHAATHQSDGSAQSSVGITLVAPEVSDELPEVEEVPEVESSGTISSGASQKPTSSNQSSGNNVLSRLPQMGEELSKSLLLMGGLLVLGAFLFRWKQHKKNQKASS